MFFNLDKLSLWLSSKSARCSVFTLSQRNIYIFPSALGFGFLLLLLIMLLTAINYQNSLIYLLTFFLGTLFFLSIWTCFLNLSGLKVEANGLARYFEGDNKNAQFNIRLSKQPFLPLAIRLGSDKKSATLVPFTQEKLIDIGIPSSFKLRGKHKLDRLYLESRFPFGLILSWTWLKLDAECLVYPQPVKGLVDGVSQGDGSQENRVLSTASDMNQLKPYQKADPTNRIVWKKYAAKDELIIRFADNASIDPYCVDWDHYSGLTEERLRYMCFDVCALSDTNSQYGFRLPGLVIETSSGKLHKQNCLDALALFKS